MYRNRHNYWRLLVVVTLSLVGSVVASTKPLSPRENLRLDGIWQVAEGEMATAPKDFPHTVMVPGLLDMAEPPFVDVGMTNQLREAFWYRRTFKVAGEAPPVALLKIHKAKYGMQVHLNGQLVGEHLPCFTPAYLDVKSHLKGNGQENELIVRVGALRHALPPDMPTGWDFEKYLYIPGIYDSVDLILTGEPTLVNVQMVPDIEAGRVRIVAEIKPGEPASELDLRVEITEAASRKKVASGSVVTVSSQTREVSKVDLTLPIENCRLWSPEDPFLYEATLRTRGDAVKVRFGMRSFRFDAGTGRAMLNGRTYFLRGSNVTMYRFFEDSERKDRPWREEWVRRLHRKFKDMHWNALRYCIGFPPEFWYDIADEEGVLIQDEFPIWLLGEAPENPVAEKIIPEYTAWMRERWNHPCVVIWDAQNESNTKETGLALQAVRHLDLSNRPWENGWAAPQSIIDTVESHPYLFIRDWLKQPAFRMSELAHLSGVPNLNAEQRKLPVPIIINEYAWLWLTRDGNPTCLTDKVYEHLLGANSTVEQRRMKYARYLAALTEFWRGHRECAGVLHFCGLGYSRPGEIPRPEGGATSDHFTDLEKLTFEPLFEEYVRDAFNPVGLMLDFWAEELPAGKAQEISVYVVNDLNEAWRGIVELVFVKDGHSINSTLQKVTVSALGREVVRFIQNTPKTAGDYTLVAQYRDFSGKFVRSLRDVKVH